METKNSPKNHQLLNRKKTDPNKFIFTGITHTPGIDMQLYKYNSTKFQETKKLSVDNLQKFDDNSYQYWLNIYGLSDPESIVAICKQLNIHNLVIQDVLDVNQRPKFQEFDDYCFFTIKSIVSPGITMQIEQISFIFNSNFLISFQEKKGDHFEHLRYRLRENAGILRQRSSDYLLYTMLEAVLDNYFKTLYQLESDVEELDLVKISADLSPVVLEKIERYKKQVHLVKKAIQPIKDFALMVERESVNFIEKKHVKYFLELKDLCLTLLDSCETIESTLESNTNLFFSVQGHRMNQVMKTLTVVTSIFIPLTFIAGIYGMNFEYMPELSWNYGYFGVWVLFVVILIVMTVYFKKKKWF